MGRITFEGNFCDIAMCRENPCPYNGMCSQRQTWERLKEYEDSGLEPEEIADFMKRWGRAVEIAGLCKKGGIDHLLELKKAEQDGKLVVIPWAAGDVIYEADPAHGVVKHTFAGEPAWMMAISALRRETVTKCHDLFDEDGGEILKSETVTNRSRLNEPLTLDELRQMDGEPVWCEIYIKGQSSFYGIVHGENVTGFIPGDDKPVNLAITNVGAYGLAWLAYRQKPEEPVTDSHQMTNADRINAMSIEEKADFLSEIAYGRETPWSEPFAEKFCKNCPEPEYTLDDGRKLRLHECDFKDGACPHGGDIVWWLKQLSEENNNGQQA